MKALILALCLALAAFLVGPEMAWAGGDSVKSYREWKNEKILEVQVRYDVIKHRIKERKSDPNLARLSGGPEGRDVEGHKLELQLQNVENALETAKELSVSDYFAGYLTKQNNRRQAFKQVAGKLSADEVAELMATYANSVFGSQSGNLPVRADSSSPDLLK